MNKKSPIKSEAILTCQEVTDLIGLSPQHVHKIETSALVKIVVKSSAIMGNYKDGFNLALQILKINNPEFLIKRMPEVIMDRIRSDFIMADRPDYEKISRKINYENEILGLNKWLIKKDKKFI